MSIRKKAAIVSVLKPVDDARNYKKIGISLAETNNYDLFMIGYPSGSKPELPNIHFLKLTKFKRLSLARLFTPLKVLKFLIKVKPELIVSNTHELQLVILINKILFGSKIIYDIQENYYKNIASSKTYPFIVRSILAGYVRLKEWSFSRFMDGFLLSDPCYVQELNFIKSPYQIVENKSTINPPDPGISQKPNSYKFIYSGTIAEEYGIFDAINFIVKLKEHIPQLSLIIIGYCAKESTLRKLRGKISNFNYIRLIGGDLIVPQNKILKELENADFTLLPYKTDAYYSNRIPTKMYDCLMLNKPMFIRKNPAWNPIVDEFDAFIFTDFSNIDNKLLEQIKSGDFYFKGNHSKASWQYEKVKLIEFIDSIFNFRQG